MMMRGSRFSGLLLLSVLAACANEGGKTAGHDTRVPLTELADKQAKFDAEARLKAQERARDFDADAMVSVADKMRVGGNYVAALQLYQQARDREPDHLGAMMGQAETFLVIGAAEEAERRYREVLDLIGRKGDKSGNLGVAAAGVARALMRQNRAGEALPFFDQAIAAGAANAEFFNYYGVTLDLLGRHDEAQLQYGKGLDLNRDDAALTNNLALSFALSEHYDTAVRLLSAVVTAHPEAAAARKNLALVYGLSGDMTAAAGLAGANQKPAEAEAQIRSIRQIAALSPELRARAIFIGLDDLPKPVPVQPPVSSGAAEAPLSPAPAATLLVQTPEARKTVPEKSVSSVAVQVGAYPTMAEAERGWGKSKKAAAAFLEGGSPVYWQADDLVRVLLPMAEGWGQAKTLCDSLSAAGVACMARRMPDLAK
ncbi:tetratricopeptide repeat protein [Govanella unica]|uniref:Tetratricopeptide repeat protein n=1 Tax=Govanella unica TaxID=2975056 RepID=A0A9X3TYA7_9PROT|nr:tetratricopeptide repeat protein [Govania unica]MDA5193779.1 tetratricopeptide repeat protein [Govania unica]